jgi:endonuclease/exonuclease/phosphatase family metal-dependent hydrolase
MAELSVASFNAHWGVDARRRRYAPFDVVEATQRIDADVVVLQESWRPDDGPAHHDLVAEALGYTSVTVAPMGRAVVEPEPKVVSRADPTRAKGMGDWCLAVLTRLPVTATEVHPLRRLLLDPSDRFVVRVDLEVDGTGVALHGTHMAHLEMGVALHTAGLRRALVPADRPGVLVGDMNMWGWCISAMAPRGWRRQRGSATFPSSRPVFRIDHLLTTDAVEVVSAEVLPDLGSDHRALRAELRLR